MADKKTEEEHLKCGRCKCWRVTNDFFNDKGRKLKTCLKCRSYRKKKTPEIIKEPIYNKDLTTLSVLQKYICKDVSNIVINYLEYDNLGSLLYYRFQLYNQITCVKQDKKMFEKIVKKKVNLNDLVEYYNLLENEISKFQILK